MKKILVILVCFFIWPTFALAEKVFSVNQAGDNIKIIKKEGFVDISVPSNITENDLRKLLASPGQELVKEPVCRLRRQNFTCYAGGVYRLSSDSSHVIEEVISHHHEVQYDDGAPVLAFLFLVTILITVSIVFRVTSIFSTTPPPALEKTATTLHVMAIVLMIYTFAGSVALGEGMLFLTLLFILIAGLLIRLRENNMDQISFSEGLLLGYFYLLVLGIALQ